MRSSTRPGQDVPAVGWERSWGVGSPRTIRGLGILPPINQGNGVARKPRCQSIKGSGYQGADGTLQPRCVGAKRDRRLEQWRNGFLETLAARSQGFLFPGNTGGTVAGSTWFQGVWKRLESMRLGALVSMCIGRLASIRTLHPGNVGALLPS